MSPRAGGGGESRFEPVFDVLLRNRLLVFLFAAVLVVLGLRVAPFDLGLGWLIPRDPVPVDAIPDLGENQQIVFTEWPGRSPQDVEDQVTYPLTVALLGVPGVQTVRSESEFGTSSIYVVFDEDIEFYWSRSRILEKLASLPPGTLPEGVRPALGPDATALGQVFWYTVEGEGFDPRELRAIQDYTVRYALTAVAGVSEVASIGGYVREYQIDVDPDALRAYGLDLRDVYEAVERSNVDVGAATIELNRVEYVIRGVGFLRGVEDLRRTLVATRDNVPVFLEHVARVGLGPALRRGVLDKEGVEAVGGVVVARQGANPLEVIRGVQAAIARIEPGLPSRTLEDGRVTQVRIEPFYDRTGLISETLGTLEEALWLEILITVIVVLVMVLHLRGSLLISATLPLAVLFAFLAMKRLGVDSNIMSLSGIAIAIGTMVDLGILVTENILLRLGESRGGDALAVVRRAVSEIAGAVLTAVSTTIVSFLPVFALTAAEGKLFRPLAFTKTFALAGAAVVALVILPVLASIVLPDRRVGRVGRAAGAALAVVAGAAVGILGSAWILGAAIAAVGIGWALRDRLPEAIRRRAVQFGSMIAAVAVTVLLAAAWVPLGPSRGTVRNLVFTVALVGGLLLAFLVFRRAYEPILRRALRHKAAFAALPVAIVLLGASVWLGFGTVFGWAPAALDRVGVGDALRGSRPWVALVHALPGLGHEFMPRLDEGSFLLMPTTMPHASIGEAVEQMQQMDRAVRAVPEVEAVVGKLGRVDSALDPAPVSMFETVVTYKSEYLRDPETGRRVLGEDGRPVRQWRDHVRTPDDIWKEIVNASALPGVTSAPRLQPIEARLVMLQSGIRAPMAVRIQGASLDEIERFGLEVERALEEVREIEPGTVFADRIVGKPYLEVEIDREAIARFGVDIRDVQDVLEIAVGGKEITRTVEGRERYAVRVRYLRELRDRPDALERVLVPAPGGVQIPLEEIAELRYTRGPMRIRSEDTFLVGYVLFDRRPDVDELAAVEAARARIERGVAGGELRLPPGGSYEFAGSYENQVRGRKTLAMLVPVVLLIVFVLLHLQFRSIPTTLLVFSSIAVAWAGGFVLLWLYGRPWFLDFAVFDVPMRQMFQVGTVHLSVAVWVGFLALFGIATDDGVVMATYLDASFREHDPDSIARVREATVAGAVRRLRPCLMTSATTILALVPVLTSTGRGSDVMLPMALPAVGGMMVVLLTLFVIPVGYSAIAERRIRRLARFGEAPQDGAPESS